MSHIGLGDQKTGRQSMLKSKKRIKKKRSPVQRGALIYRTDKGEIRVATKWRWINAKRSDGTIGRTIKPIERFDCTDSFMLIHNALLNEKIEQVRAEAQKRLKEEAGDLMPEVTPESEKLTSEFDKKLPVHLDPFHVVKKSDEDMGND